MSYADYVRERMKNTLRTEIAEAEGNPITITDGLSRTFKGIKIFGESTQNGTPTPLVPIDIVSVDNPTLTVGDETLTQTQATTIPHTLRGIEVPSTYTGYTYTKSEKYCVADYVYKQGGRAYKVQKIIGKVFDGTETFSVGNKLTNTVRCYYNPPVFKSIGNDNPLGVISTHFKASTDTGDEEGVMLTGGYPNGLVNIRISWDRLGITSDSDNTTITNNLKAWLATNYSTNPVVVCYDLYSPIITDITDTPEGQALLSLYSYRGTTNISLDTNLGYIQAKYVKK